jgi:50S ribosomal protein L16 3-hydroxylase
MLHDDRHVFINGESFKASGRDAHWMKQLANERQLDARSVAKFSSDALELLTDWCDAGWVHTC